MRIDVRDGRFGRPTTTEYINGQEPLPKSRFHIPLVDPLVDIFTRNHLESGHRTLSRAARGMYYRSLESPQGLRRKALLRGSRALDKIAEKPQAAEALGAAKHVAFAAAFALGATVFIQLATIILGQTPIAH